MFDCLADDVRVEILVRLPPKSLLKCRAVCKSWNSLIKSPYFISTHLQYSISLNVNNSLILRLFAEGKDRFALHFDRKTVNQLNQVYHPRLIRGVRHLQMVGSCHGLVCLYTVYGSNQQHISSFVFWNPSIHKSFAVSHPRQCYFNGFGFDSIANDFKVLVGHESEEVELYSLNSNSWKSIALPDPNVSVRWNSRNVFVNGAVHFWGYMGTDDNKTELILRFDLNKESFLEEIKLPDALNNAHHDIDMVKFGESSIALIALADQFDVWVMKEYGVRRLWSKVFGVSIELEKWPISVIGFWENKQLLLGGWKGRIVAFDLDGFVVPLPLPSSSELRMESGFRLIQHACVDVYVESLVLLDKGEDISIHEADSTDSFRCMSGEHCVALIKQLASLFGRIGNT